MKAAVLALLLNASLSLSEGKVDRSQAELQSAMDAIIVRCSAAPNLRAKALSEKLVQIDFVDPPLDLPQDAAFKCVMDEGQKLRGVTFGIIGREQYLDDVGNRR